MLIVDEAAMLSTKHLAAVTGQARAAGAKLILAGDDKQLASIERGGLFGALKEQHGGAELHEVVRVSDAEQRRAFNLMHKGEFLPALAIFAGRARSIGPARQEEARAALVEQWGRDIAADPDKTRFVFAYTNADVKSSMPRCATCARSRGRSAPIICWRRRTATAFAEGDRIQFTGTARRREDRKGRVVNGAVGTIRAIEGDRVTVALDGKPGAPSGSFPSSPARLTRTANSTSSGTAMPARSTRGRGARSIRPTSITASIGAAPRAMSR